MAGIEHPGQSSRRQRLAEVAAVFLKLGITAFGGPAAHIAMMDDEIVKRRKWIERNHFLDLLGAANLIPGPNSTELAIHLGYRRAGWLGLITAGCCFILPAMLIVLVFAYIYVHYGALPELSWILYGIKPVIMAIVLQALWNLAKTAVKNRILAVVALGAVALSIAGLHEIALLALAGTAVMLIYNRSKLANRYSSLMIPMLGMYAQSAEVRTTSMSVMALFLTFLKIGSVLYGSGYVLLAFLQADFVDRFHVLAPEQLLDAVAIGQFTPGPVFTTATFIGYLLAGTPGALAATLGIFLPAFVFVALVNPWVPRLRKSSWFSGFLDGVNAASLSLMAVVSWQLGKAAILDVYTAALAVIALILLVRYRWNSSGLVIGGAATGFIISMLK